MPEVAPQVDTTIRPGHAGLARALHWTAQHPRLQRPLVAAHVAVFEASRGRVLGRWLGAPVVVLTTIGRRTGRVRRTPMIYFPDNHRLVVVPVNAGSAKVPGWWVNLQTAGVATATTRQGRASVTIRIAQAHERYRLWSAAVRASPVLAQFREYTDRDMPLIVLEPQTDFSWSRANSAAGSASRIGSLSGAAAGGSRPCGHPQSAEKPVDHGG